MRARRNSLTPAASTTTAVTTRAATGPATTQAAIASSALAASVAGNRHGIGAPQQRARPARSSQPATGTRARADRSAPQEQCEREVHDSPVAVRPPTAIANEVRIAASRPIQVPMNRASHMRPTVPVARERAAVSGRTGTVESMPRPVRLVLAVLITLALAWAAVTVSAPWWLVRPGPVLDAATSTGGVAGRIHVLTITAQDITWAQAVQAMLTGQTLLPLPTSAEQYRRQAGDQVRDSMTHARAAAQGITGQDVPNPGEVGFVGPSAGLALALSMVDAAFPGDLTAGTRVAASASITSEGTTGAVGGLGEKLHSAREAGMQVVFVAPGAAGTAGARSDDALRVVEVASLTEAVAWLCQRSVDAAAPDAVCARNASLTR